MKIESILQSPTSSGRPLLLAHMEGKHLTRSEAMQAKCFECCNGYADGREDCRITDCPLYPFMPYRQKAKLLRKTKAGAQPSQLAAWHASQKASKAANASKQATQPDSLS